MNVLDSKDKYQTLSKLFVLKNCINEFDDEVQFKQLLIGLNNKLSYNDNVYISLFIIKQDQFSKDDEINFHDAQNI